MSGTSIDDMGVLNSGWGICGFTSSLYALYTHSVTQKQNSLAEGGKLTTRMLAEMKSYLKTLQADGETAMLNDIEEFTKSFGGVHAHFTIAKYIERINLSVMGTPSATNDRFGIGLPPEVVVDYLKRICGFKNARIVDLSSTAGELILGVADTTGAIKTSAKYNNLAHYLYSLNLNIYSWGNQFASVSQAMDSVGTGSNFGVVYKIAVT